MMEWHLNSLDTCHRDAVDKLGTSFNEINEFLIEIKLFYDLADTPL